MKLFKTKAIASILAMALCIGVLAPQSAEASDLAARHPRDGGTYSTAAYLCASGAWKIDRQWPSMRTCMDYYLATHVTNGAAKQFHIVQLYTYTRNDQDLWNKAWSLVGAYTAWFRAMGTVFVQYGAIAVCTWLGAVTAGWAGVACDIALTSVMLYYGI